MAVTFVGNGALATNNTVTTQAIAQPTCSVGDLLIAFVANRSGTANTISPPDGTWTQVIQVNGTTAVMQYAVFWKTATATTGSHTFSKAADDNIGFGGVIGAWTGHNASSPLDATASGSTQSGAVDDVTFPAFDPTGVDSHIIFAAFYRNDGTTFAAAMSSDVNPDCTIRFDLESIAAGFTIAVTSGNTTDGSNIASRTWASNSGANSSNAGVFFGLATVPIVTFKPQVIMI